MATKRSIRISVRNLVEFVLRSGDLAAMFTGNSRMLDGGKIHRKIQKAQGAEYQPEVSLSLTVERPDVTLEVGGRADGVIVRQDENGQKQVTIDEIKSTTSPLDTIGEFDQPLYWAQAKCYAYIYAVLHDLDSIRVRLSYCHFVTGEIKNFEQPYSADELAEFFHNLVDQYLAWAERVQNWREIRDASARQVEFPFASFRDSQRQLAVAVYQTLRAGRKLYAQAPTGTGKTMATIFPSVKAAGAGLIEKIFFLTAKTVTRELAEEAFAKLRHCGLKWKILTLTAKDKICFRPEAACTAEECEYARGYFDRINAALADSWETEAFTREAVEEYARRHRVCPFEFSLDLALWADAVICDYNYVFDPRVYLKRFFGENGGEYCFLVDEAHNLVDRARDMFSAELARLPFRELKRAVKRQLPKLAQAAGKINLFLLKAGKLCRETGIAGQADFFVDEEPPDAIFPLLHKFIGLAEEWLAKNEPAAFRETLLERYFEVYAFLRIAEMYDERYVTYGEKPANDVKLKLFCVDPSYLLQQALLRGRTAIFFSATLAPLDYFTQMLGGEDNDGRMAVASPFSPDHLGLMVADTVSTTYKMREQTYDIVVENIAAAVGAKAGNYLVFFPSYRYLEEVSRRFCRKYPAIKAIQQAGGMTEAERAEFLRQFAGDGTGTLVGFAVLGGVFGEGIDLTGERLVGAVIVGVGLPQVCLERDIIKKYFDRNDGQGFAYAYVYPGMNKVMQSAGRVIRTEDDRGVVLLIDERFSAHRYRQLFPPEWQRIVRAKDSAAVARAAQRFWEKQQA